MDTEEGGDWITDDEIVYRRVLARSDYCVPNSDRPIQWIAYKPSKRDSSGISVWRAKHVQPDQAIRTAKPGKSYYLIALKVRDLRQLGAEVVSTPGEGDPGHATITSLSWNRYRDDKNDVKELAMSIAIEASKIVLGPFRVPDAEPSESGTGGAVDGD